MIKENNSNYRWIILLIGVLAQMAFSIAFAGISVSGVLFQEGYHFSLEEVGFVLGCMGLGVAISEMIWGILTDKLGDKIVLTSGLILMAIVFAYIGYFCTPSTDNIPDYRYLGGMLIVAGFVGGSVNSSSGRAVMSWFGQHERGFAMSIRQTAIPFGAAIGTIMFPFIVTKQDFQFAFLIMASICLIVAIIVVFGLKTIDQKQIKSQIKTSIKSPFKRLTTWKVALSGGALTFPQMAILTFSSVFLVQEFNVKMIVISIILASIQLIGGILRIVFGKITDQKQNRVQLIFKITMITSISSIMLGLFSQGNVIVVIILLIITGLFANAWHGILYTEIAVRANKEYAGRALGMIGTMVFLVSFITPYLIPYILNISSWQSVWIIVGVVTAMTLFLMKQQPKEK